MNVRRMTTSRCVVSTRCVTTQSGPSSVDHASTVDLATSSMSPPAAVMVSNQYIGEGCRVKLRTSLDIDLGLYVVNSTDLYFWTLITQQCVNKQRFLTSCDLDL